MTEPAPAHSPRPLDFAAIRDAVRAHRTLAIGFFAIVVLVAALATALAPRTYQAVALIQLMPRAGREVEVREVMGNDGGGYLESQERARTQIQIILSRGVLEKVLEEYRGLGHDDLGSGPEGAIALARTMTVRPRENTQLVEIAVEHADPERAAVVANLVASVYARLNLEARTDAARESKGWIDERVQAAQTELESASAAVMAFKETHDLVDADEGGNGITARLASLQAALGEATTQRVLLQGKLESYLRLARNGEFLVLASMFPSDATLDTISRERAQIAVESAEVLARYGEQHPEHQRAVERMARVDALLEQAVQRNVEGVRTQVKTLARQEQEIDAELQGVKAELLERQRLQADYGAVKLDEERARQLFDSLKARTTEVDLQARSELNDVRIVDLAVAPTRPSSPNPPLNMAVAVMVGLFGGIGLAVLRQRLPGLLSPGEPGSSAR